MTPSSSDCTIPPSVCLASPAIRRETQNRLIVKFPVKSTIRTVAAGTVARTDGLVDKDGYVIFAWVLDGGAKDIVRARAPSLLVWPPMYSGPETLPFCSQVTSSGVSTREERAQAVASYRPRGSSAATLANGAADDDVVKLERGRNKPAGQASFWESRVEGGRWTRSWGYLAQVAPFCLSRQARHTLSARSHIAVRELGHKARRRLVRAWATLDMRYDTIPASVTHLAATLHVPQVQVRDGLWRGRCCCASCADLARPGRQVEAVGREDAPTRAAVHQG